MITPRALKLPKKIPYIKNKITKLGLALKHLMYYKCKSPAYLGILAAYRDGGVGGFVLKIIKFGIKTMAAIKNSSTMT